MTNPRHEIFRFLSTEVQLAKLRNPVTLSPAKVAEMAADISHDIDQDYARSTDLGLPGVMLIYKGEFCLLVDGHRRLFNAAEQGVGWVVDTYDIRHNTHAMYRAGKHRQYKTWLKLLGLKD